MAAVSDTASVCWRHPPRATKSQQRKIPLEPVRAGAQDGSTIDNTATDPGTDTTTSKNTAHEATTTAAGHSLQVCSCGWEKITSAKGLKIHQAKKKCLRVQRQGLALTSTSYEATSQISRVKHSDGTQTKVHRASTPLSLRRVIQAQKGRWRDPPNHRDLQRRKRSKGTDRV